MITIELQDSDLSADPKVREWLEGIAKQIDPRSVKPMNQQLFSDGFDATKPVPMYWTPSGANWGGL